MEDWTKRFAVAALFSFAVFFFALPVACCGFAVYDEHLYGDVETGGPQAILSAMGVSAGLALVVMIVVMRRTRSR